jgi:hypothetical protein
MGKRTLLWAQQIENVGDAWLLLQSFSSNQNFASQCIQVWSILPNLWRVIPLLIWPDSSILSFLSLIICLFLKRACLSLANLFWCSSVVSYSNSIWVLGKYWLNHVLQKKNRILQKYRIVIRTDINVNINTEI